MWEGLFVVHPMLGRLVFYYCKGDLISFNVELVTYLVKGI